MWRSLKKKRKVSICMVGGLLLAFSTSRHVCWVQMEVVGGVESEINRDQRG